MVLHSYFSVAVLPRFTRLCRDMPHTLEVPPSTLPCQKTGRPVPSSLAVPLPMFSATTIDSAPPAVFAPATTAQPDEATRTECWFSTAAEATNRARREGMTAREGRA